jgi:hypothetical protein
MAKKNPYSTDRGWETADQMELYRTVSNPNPDLTVLDEFIKELSGQWLTVVLRYGDTVSEAALRSIVNHRQLDLWAFDRICRKANLPTDSLDKLFNGYPSLEARYIISRHKNISLETLMRTLPDENYKNDSLPEYSASTNLRLDGKPIMTVLCDSRIPLQKVLASLKWLHNPEIAFNQLRRTRRVEEIDAATKPYTDMGYSVMEAVQFLRSDVSVEEAAEVKDLPFSWAILIAGGMGSVDWLHVSWDGHAELTANRWLH